MGKLTVKCFCDPKECGYFADGACTRFDRPCEDVHIDIYKEDGEELQPPEEPEELPEENRERPKLSKGDMILKWAAIVITAIAYPVVLYKVWMLWQSIR